MPKQKEIPKPSRIPMILSIVAILISAASFWDSHQAKRLNYESSLPELSETTELVNPPIESGKALKMKVTITNFGRTTARNVTPVFRFEFRPATEAFDPNARTTVLGDAKRTSSEIAAGDHYSYFSTSNVDLQHDHDVAAVLSGTYNFYVFGVVPFQDMDGGMHEFHFCRQLSAPMEGADPGRLYKCRSYNYSD